jgi:uncharacterized protein (DUF433 family)
MGGKPITPTLEQNRDEIIALYEGGASIDDLSDKFGCSNTPIRKFLIRNCVEFHPPIRPAILEASRDAVITAYQSGDSTADIAEKFGVDRNTVSLFLQKNKVRRTAPLSARTFFIETDADKGMLAGLLLGEGSIIIRGKGASVRIVNQDTAILGWLNKFGGKIYWSKPRKSSPNPCGVWDLSGAIDVFHCLSSIEHLLVGKKKSLARVAIKVLVQNYGLRETP